MAKNSGIEWTHHTFNPWWGCTKVSAGCTNCYAETWDTRTGGDHWGPKSERRFFEDKHFEEPLAWNRAAVAAGERHRVFCASMADVFERHMIESVHGRMMYARALLWKLIEATPALDWLLLTKRPENILSFIPRKWHLKTPPTNVWYGTSVEDQAAADKRIPQLLNVPATVRFLSCEPLLGPVDLTPWLKVGSYVGKCSSCGWGHSRAEYAALGIETVPQSFQNRTRIGTAVYCPDCRPQLQWVIAGGESGPGARPMHPDWARSLRDQCQAADVAFHFKQWGEWEPVDSAGDDPDWKGRSVQALSDGTVTDTTWNGGPGMHLEGSQAMWRSGKKAAGRELDGRTWDEYPAVPA